MVAHGLSFVGHPGVSSQLTNMSLILKCSARLAVGLSFAGKQQARPPADAIESPLCLRVSQQGWVLVGRAQNLEEPWVESSTPSSSNSGALLNLCICFLLAKCELLYVLPGGPVRMEREGALCVWNTCWSSLPLPFPVSLPSTILPSPGSTSFRGQSLEPCLGQGSGQWEDGGPHREVRCGVVGMLGRDQGPLHSSLSHLSALLCLSVLFPGAAVRN